MTDALATGGGPALPLGGLTFPPICGRIGGKVVTGRTQVLYLSHLRGAPGGYLRPTVTPACRTDGLIF